MSKKRSNTDTQIKNDLGVDENCQRNKKVRLDQVPPDGDAVCVKEGCTRNKNRRGGQLCEKHHGECEDPSCTNKSIDNNNRGPQLCMDHRTLRRKAQNQKSSKNYIKRLKTQKIDANVELMSEVFLTCAALQEIKNNKYNIAES
jgi:hypothetical protein